MSCRCTGEQDSHFTFREEGKKKGLQGSGGGWWWVSPLSLLSLPLFLRDSFSFSVGSRSSLALQKAQTGMQRRLCREYKKIGDPWEGSARLNRSL